MNLPDFFKSEARRLADGVADIADAESPKERQKKYLLLLALLSDFRQQSNVLLVDAVASAINEAHPKLLKTLPRKFRQRAAITPDQYNRFANDAVNAALERIAALLSMIQQIAVKLRIGRDRLLRAVLGKYEGETTDTEGRELLAKKIIRVRGVDGVDRSYPPSHYGELLESGAADIAKAEVAKSMSENIGSDLVRISAPTHKDFCDIFAGQVFSLSGTDPRCYPLSVIPNGGCPMHPFCVHTLQPVAPDQFSDKQLRAMSTLPHQFVELALSNGKKTTNDWQRLFLTKSPEDWGL